MRLSPLKPASSAKLFVFGATIGPIVDSFHNQCLLRYDLAPITVKWPLDGLSGIFEQEYMLCSSWSVPLLLGFAYVVLGDILPRVFHLLLDSTFIRKIATGSETFPNSSQDPKTLRIKAVAAVLTTIVIIKASQYLELHEPFSNALASGHSIPFVETSSQGINYAVLLFAAFVQWYFLDGTIPALLAAGVTSVGGPLSELPFVANGFWEYVPDAADYFPLANVPGNIGLLTPLLREDYQQLALSSITGPCYWAVTLDAIALGRWFQSTTRDDE